MCSRVGRVGGVVGFMDLCNVRKFLVNGVVGGGGIVLCRIGKGRLIFHGVVELVELVEGGVLLMAMGDLSGCYSVLGCLRGVDFGYCDVGGFLVWCVVCGAGEG